MRSCRLIRYVCLSTMLPLLRGTRPWWERCRRGKAGSSGGRPCTSRSPCCGHWKLVRQRANRSAGHSAPVAAGVQWGAGVRGSLRARDVLRPPPTSARPRPRPRPPARPPADVGHHALRLHLLAQHRGRQQAAQVEAVALQQGEGQALVVLRYSTGRYSRVQYRVVHAVHVRLGRQQQRPGSSGRGPAAGSPAAGLPTSSRPSTARGAPARPA